MPINTAIHQNGNAPTPSSSVSSGSASSLGSAGVGGIMSPLQNGNGLNGVNVTMPTSLGMLPSNGLDQVQHNSALNVVSTQSNDLGSVDSAANLARYNPHMTQNFMQPSGVYGLTGPMDYK